MLLAIFSQILVEIASWSQFEGLVVKVVIGIRSVFAVYGAAYFTFGWEKGRI